MNTRYRCYSINDNCLAMNNRSRNPLSKLYDILLNMERSKQIHKVIYMQRKPTLFRMNDFVIIESITSNNESISNFIAKGMEIFYSDCVIMLAIEKTFIDELTHSQQYILIEQGVLTSSNFKQVIFESISLESFLNNTNDINVMIFHDGATIFELGGSANRGTGIRVHEV